MKCGRLLSLSPHSCRSKYMLFKRIQALKMSSLYILYLYNYIGTKKSNQSAEYWWNMCARCAQQWARHPEWWARVLMPLMAIHQIYRRLLMAMMPLMPVAAAASMLCKSVNFPSGDKRWQHPKRSENVPQSGFWCSERCAKRVSEWQEVTTQKKEVRNFLN